MDNDDSPPDLQNETTIPNDRLQSETTIPNDPNDIIFENDDIKLFIERGITIIHFYNICNI
jgi:hypothetical protein